MNRERYVSMFKINGIPILPPLMTAARRREMLAYKELALALETRLKLEAKQADDLENMSTIENEYMKVSSLLQDHFSPKRLQDRRINGLKNPSKFLEKSDTFIYDIKTNTVIIPGGKEGAVGDGGNTGIARSTGNTKFSNICQVAKDLTPQRIVTRKPFTPIRTPKITKYVAPSISVKPPTPETKTIKSNENVTSSTPISQKNQLRTDPDSLRKKTPRRASTSPSLKDSSPCMSAPPLVRSNSFTLDSPSPVLLEHMVRNRSKNFEILEKSNVNPPPPEVPRRQKPPRPSSEGFVINVAPTLPRRPAASVATTTNTPSTTEQPKQSTLLINNSSLFKNRKSPYELKINGKSKTLKKHKTPLKKISSVTLRPRLSATHHRSRMLITSASLKGEQQETAVATPTPNTRKFDSVKQKFNEIEERHRLKLMNLIKRQQDEQRMMQETFERQQKQLLDEFNAGLMSLQLPSVLDRQENDPNNSINTTTNHCNTNNDNNNNKNSTSKKTSLTSLDGSDYFDMTDTLTMPTTVKNSPRCSRRLFDGSNQPPPPPTPRQRMTLTDSRILSPTHSRIPSPTDSRIPSPTRRRTESAAATIINAHAKGYLVRRLFHTEYVQNIVQTIRDTLLFVLDFHRETENEITGENVVLKSRLLQQLTSACNSLHSVFFSLDIKQRMAIIAKDRIYIKNKTQIRNQNSRQKN